MIKLWLNERVAIWNSMRLSDGSINLLCITWFPGTYELGNVKIEMNLLNQGYEI